MGRRVYKNPERVEEKPEDHEKRMRNLYGAMTGAEIRAREEAARRHTWEDDKRRKRTRKELQQRAVRESLDAKE